MAQKDLLVIGGTYFTGRVFSIYASRKPEEYRLTLVNRGSRPLRRDGVEELVADRTDAAALASVLAGRTFDAVIDFCAYNPGDIRNVFASGAKFDRYIEFSTVNVYDPAQPAPLSEQSSLVDPDAVRARTDYPAELKSYLVGKRVLEDELVGCAREAGAGYTILRPAFLYGPLDYTPRLLQYLQWIAHRQPVPFPAGSDSKFSFCYVKDAANLVFKVLATDATRDAAYNLAAPDAMDWQRFEELLSGLTDEPQTHTHLSVAQIDEQRIPIMFPIDTNEWYTGDAIADAVGGFEFTPFEQGLQETWDVFKDVL